MIPSGGVCGPARIGETRDTIGVLYEQGGCSLVLGTVEAAEVLAHGRVPPPPPPPPPVRPGPVVEPGVSRVEVKLAMPAQLGNTTHGKAPRARLSQPCRQGADGATSAQGRIAGCAHCCCAEARTSLYCSDRPASVPRTPPTGAPLAAPYNERASQLTCFVWTKDELEAGGVCKRLAHMDEGGSGARGLSYNCCGANAGDYDCRSRQRSDG